MSGRDGGPAFPRVGAAPGHPSDVPGMSLRDYFAGQALAGLCAQAPGNVRTKADAEMYLKGVPVMAYRIADCMLAARAPDPREEEDDDGE